jgi:hypothetical protein
MVTGIPNTIDKFLGYICKVVPEDLPPRHISNVLNMSHDIRGALMTRYGYVSIAEEFGEGPINGLAELKIPTKPNELLAISGTGIYKYDGINKFNLLTKNLFAYQEKVEFTQFQNRLFFVDGKSKPISYDGSTFTFVSVPDDPRARYILLAKGRLFIAGDDTNPSFLWFCSLENPDDWRQPIAATGGVITVGRDDGERITGLELIGDAVVIFKEKSIWILNIDGDPYAGGGVTPQWVLRKTDSVTGCLFGAHRTIRKIGNQILYLSERGLFVFSGFRNDITNAYRFDNYRSVQVSEMIESKALDEQNALFDFNWEDATAIYYDYKYILTLKKTNASPNYYAFVLDTRVVPEIGNQIGSWSFYDNYRFNIYLSSSIDGKEIVFAGDSETGKVYRIQADFPVNNDDGKPIKSFFVSAGIFSGGKQITAQARRTQFLFETNGAHGVFHALSVNYRDFREISYPFPGGGGGATWENVSWENFKWGDVAGKLHIKEAVYPPIETWGRIFRYKWSNFKSDNSNEEDILPFKFYHFIFNLKPRRQRNQILKVYDPNQLKAVS